MSPGLACIALCRRIISFFTALKGYPKKGLNRKNNVRHGALANNISNSLIFVPGYKAHTFFVFAFHKGATQNQAAKQVTLRLLQSMMKPFFC